MNEPVRPSVERVQSALRAAGLAVTVRQFPDSTRTAAEAAAAVGTQLAQIVKSLLFIFDGRPVLALVSGSNRLDPGRLSALVGSQVTRADADTVRRLTGYAIGGVPPIGFPEPIPTYVDEDLLAFETVWAAAGTPHHVFEITPADLVRVTGGILTALRE